MLWCYGGGWGRRGYLRGGSRFVPTRRPAHVYACVDAEMLHIRLLGVVRPYLQWAGGPCDAPGAAQLRCCSRDGQRGAGRLAKHPTKHPRSRVAPTRAAASAQRASLPIDVNGVRGSDMCVMCAVSLVVCSFGTFRSCVCDCSCTRGQPRRRRHPDLRAMTGRGNAACAGFWGHYYGSPPRVIRATLVFVFA